VKRVVFGLRSAAR